MVVNYLALKENWTNEQERLRNTSRISSVPRRSGVAQQDQGCGWRRHRSTRESQPGHARSRSEPQGICPISIEPGPRALPYPSSQSETKAFKMSSLTSLFVLSKPHVCRI